MERWGLTSAFGIRHYLGNKSTLPRAIYVFSQHQQEKRIFDNSHAYYNYKLSPSEFTLAFLLHLLVSWLPKTQLLPGLLLLGLPHFFFFFSYRLCYLSILVCSHACPCVLFLELLASLPTNHTYASDISNHGPSPALFQSRFSSSQEYKWAEATSENTEKKRRGEGEEG